MQVASDEVKRLSRLQQARLIVKLERDARLRHRDLTGARQPQACAALACVDRDGIERDRSARRAESDLHRDGDGNSGGAGLGGVGALKSARAREASFALCHIDLDQFKIINDNCGHSAGDALLGQVGALLKSKIRWRDTVAS